MNKQSVPILFPSIRKAALSIMALPGIRTVYRHAYSSRRDAAIKQKDRSITIELSNRCNLRCPMCPTVSITDRREPMEMNVAFRLVDEAVALGCRELWLNHANEPLMDGRWIQLVDYAHGRNMLVGMYTNGTLLRSYNPTDFEKLAWLRVSFDPGHGTEAGRIYEMLRLIRYKCPYVDCSVYVTCPPAGYLYWIKTVFMALSFRVVPQAGWTLGVTHKGPQYPCHDPTRLIVLSDGRVVGCCADMAGENVFGSIHKESLQNIWNGTRFAEFAKSHNEWRGADNRLCAGCSCLSDRGAFVWWK